MHEQHDLTAPAPAPDRATLAAAVREMDSLPGVRSLLVRWQDGRLRLTLTLADGDPGTDTLVEKLREWVAECAPDAPALASPGVPAPAALPGDAPVLPRGGLFLLKP